MDFHKILNSPSSLGRFKREMAINRSGAPTSSQYILSQRIRRGLKSMTDEQYNTIRKAHLSPNTKCKKPKLIHQYLTRLDKMEPNMIVYAAGVYESEGPTALFEIMRVPLADLRKRAKKWIGNQSD